MARPTQLAHVAYKTRNIDAMIKWYQTLLEADIRFQSPPLVFLSFDDEHHRIALANLAVIDPDGATPTTENSTALHTAYTFASAAELLENYGRVKDLGIEPAYCIHHGPTLSIYYVDPDGNHVECQADVYETAEAANDFMHGELFTKNPIGVKLDPSELLERCRQGATEEELLKYHEDAEPFSV